MTGKILLPEDIDALGKAYLLERGHRLVFCDNNPKAIVESGKDCSAVITRNAVIRGEIMDAMPSLRVIARHGVGVDNIDLYEAERRGIWVTNGPFSNINAVAEQTIGAIIACARALVFCDHLVRTGSYEQRKMIKGIELSGKTLGIIGFGKIGRLVAKKAYYGLDMKIACYDPFLSEVSEEFPVDLYTSCNELMQNADVVTLHLPLTEGTKGCISKEKLSCLKENAVLINYAREELLDVEGLLDLLEDDHLAGAALDFPSSNDEVMSRLKKCSKVLLSPHTAAFTKESLQNMALHAAVTVDEVLSGVTPSWYVVKGSVI